MTLKGYETSKNCNSEVETRRQRPSHLTFSYLNSEVVHKTRVEPREHLAQRNYAALFTFSQANDVTHPFCL